MISRCPACHSVMLGDSPWCAMCARCWEVRTFVEAQPEPMQRSYSRPRKSKGMGSRCLSVEQREAIKEKLATGKYGWQSKIARELFVSVATVARIAKEIRA